MWPNQTTSHVQFATTRHKDGDTEKDKEKKKKVLATFGKDTAQGCP